MLLSPFFVFANGLNVRDVFTGKIINRENIGRPVETEPFRTRAAKRAYFLAVRSSSVAAAAFALTEAMPFFILRVDAYLSLCPITSLFAALRTK